MAQPKEYKTSFVFGAKKAPSFDKAFSSMNNTIKNMAKGLAAFAATKVSFAAIQDAADTFAGFEQSMANVQALSMADGETFDAMTEKAMEMGRKTSKTAQEAADALGYMSLAGWDAQRSMDSLEPVLRLSEAGQLDLARTSDLVTDSMSAISLQADQLPTFLDQVAQTSRKSNTNIDAMMEAFIKLGDSVKDIPLDETSAALGVLANRGLKGAEAGNSLNSLMANFKVKSGQAYKALQQLGVSAYDSDGKFKGIQRTMEELNEATKGMTQQQRDMYFTMIGGKEQLTTLNDLMSGLNTVTEDGGSEFDNLRKQIQASDGALYEMADTMNDTMQGAFARLSSATDDFKIRMVDTVAPIFTPLIDTLASKIPNATEKMSSGLMKGAKWMKILFMKPKTAEDRSQSILDLAGLTGMDITKAAEMQNLLSQGFRGKAIGIMEMMGLDPGAVQRITGLIDSITEKIGEIKTGGQKVLDWFQPAIDWVTTSGLPMVAEGFLSAADGVMGFISEVANNWEANGPIIMGFIGGLAGLLIIQKVASAFSGFMSILSSVASPAGMAVMAIGAIITAGIYLYENWDKIKEAAHNLKEWFIGVFEGVGEWFSNLWGGITDTFKGFINFFIEGLNWMIGGLNKLSFTTPDWLPGDLGGKSFGINIPQIPLLAQGGIATAPTLAMVGEGKEQEAILPLSKLESFLQSGSLDAVSPLKRFIQEFLNAPPPSPAGGAPMQVTYSPVYNLYGSAGKEEVQEAGKESLQNFDEFLNEREEQWRRTAFRR